MSIHRAYCFLCLSSFTFGKFYTKFIFMLSPEVIEGLKKQRIQLLKELEGINSLLGESNEATAPIKITTAGKPKKETPVAEGQPKGGDNWETYVQKILSILGGSAKAVEVISYARKANPKIDGELIVNAVRGKLSKLAINQIIGVTKADIKSEGYVYHVKK